MLLTLTRWLAQADRYTRHDSYAAPTQRRTTWRAPGPLVPGDARRTGGRSPAGRCAPQAARNRAPAAPGRASSSTRPRRTPSTAWRSWPGWPPAAPVVHPRTEEPLASWHGATRGGALPLYPDGVHVIEGSPGRGTRARRMGSSAPQTPRPSAARNKSTGRIPYISRGPRSCQQCEAEGVSRGSGAPPRASADA